MKFPPEKLMALAKLSAITLVVLVAFWFGLMRPAQARLQQQTKANAELIEKNATRRNLVKRAEQIKADHESASQELRQIEEEMVVGDAYLWILKTLRDFEIANTVEFSKYDPPTLKEEMIGEDVSYKVASYIVSGTANYHDLGKFLALFENTYPHIRIFRLEMEPLPQGANAEEKLSFIIEMRVLVKPATPALKSGAKP